MNVGPMNRAVAAAFVAFWRGNVPLSQAFWEYAIVLWHDCKCCSDGSRHHSGRGGLPDAVGIGLFLIPVPYIVIAVVGVVRSANRNEGVANVGWLGQGSRDRVGRRHDFHLMNLRAFDTGDVCRSRNHGLTCSSLQSRVISWTRGQGGELWTRTGCLSLQPQWWLR